MNRLDSRGFGAVEAVLILVVVGLLGFVGYRAYGIFTGQKDNDVQLSQKNQQKEKTKVENETVVTEVPKVNEGNTFGYEFNYSDGWEVLAHPMYQDPQAEYLFRDENIPFEECTGPFIINKNDPRQIIVVDILGSDGEGGTCTSDGVFTGDFKWDNTDKWRGSYLYADAKRDQKLIDGRYLRIALFNYRTFEIKGKSELAKISTSFNLK